MFYVLYGQDDFSLRQALDEIRADLDDPQTLAVNTVRLDGQSLTLNELRNNCNTTPFLSLYRLVVVDGLLKRFEAMPGRSRSGKKGAKAGVRPDIGEWQDLPLLVEQMPTSTVLVTADGEIRSANPLLKRVASLAKVRVFNSLRGQRLRDWVGERVAKSGGAITPQAVSLICQLVGGNLWTMDNEISKLALYAQGRPITADDVGQLSSYAHETSIFALVDAIVEGRNAEAEDLLCRLCQEGYSAGHILAMIARQFRLIALVHELSAGPSPGQLRGELSALSDYALDRTTRQASLYDLQHIQHAYHKLAETDMAIKIGRWDEQSALELLVADLTMSRSYVS